MFILPFNVSRNDALRRFSMKILRYLLPMALVLSLCGRAKADDFQMVVVDPPPPIVNITTYDITLPNFTYTDIPFTDCQPGELPSGSPSYQGCIAFLNGTGVNLTALTLTVPNLGGIVGQTADCPTDPNKIFTGAPTCPVDPTSGAWTLIFTGGVGITPSEFFVVAENGAAPGDFPAISANFAAAATPEPASLWFMATGVLMGGVFLSQRSRRAMAEAQL
jgi:hypothetical protein